MLLEARSNAVCTSCEMEIIAEISKFTEIAGGGEPSGELCTDWIIFVWKSLSHTSHMLNVEEKQWKTCDFLFHE